MRTLLFAALALAATSAYADGPSVYIGAGIAEARADNDNFDGDRNRDIDHAGWKVLAGFRPIPPVAIEADYMGLGHLSRDSRDFNFDGRDDTNANAFAGYVVGFLPLPVPYLDVFGKAGVARWRFDGHTNSSFFAIDDHGTDFAWGGGAQVHYGSFGVRLEYEQFNVRNTDGVKLLTLDVLFRIL
jgi:opacity protein-like surface antigen